MEHHRRLNFWWGKSRLISLIFLILLWLVSGVAMVFALRANNLEMLRLRQAVFTADEEGKDVEAPLKALQLYVTTHMNTTLPKLGSEKSVQLKASYDRLVAAEEARVSAERTAITTQATAYCESALAKARLTDRVKCIQDYVEARPVAPAKVYPKELFSFDFVSPFWSPDKAGWLTVVFIVTSALLLIRLLVGLSVRRALKDGI